MRVSVVVNTINRADSLQRTLQSLTQLDYPEFEVVVVVGPTQDATMSVVGVYGDAIKVGRCDTANLSSSRNVGICMASGDLVAFIDDDAVPDPQWLRDLVPVFDDPEVAAAGGPVYDDRGVLYALYSLGDVHGDVVVWKEGVNPSRVLAAPSSSLIVYPIGTNAVFRRSAVVEIGGFDEEFEYYLDETDVCRRLIDRGWVVEARNDGVVYHDFKPGAMRSDDGVARNFYPVLKNRLYFALRHALPRLGLAAVAGQYEHTVDRHRDYNRGCVRHGLLDEAALETFEHDAKRAADDGSARALEGPKTKPPAWFERTDSRFVDFLEKRSQPLLHIAIVTREYLPLQLNGIARLSHELGTALASRGHVVRILTEGVDQVGTHYEKGLWVHRVAVPPAGTLRDFSAAVEHELRRIDSGRTVDVVQMPNWNSEGIAVLEAGGFTTVLGLHTPLATVARLDPRIDADDPGIRERLALERRCYEEATAYLACGPASLAQVESDYAIALPRRRVGFVPFGIPDLPELDPLVVAPGNVNVLFVGRLEARKGVDTLLDAVARLLPLVPDVAFTIVGNDRITSESGGSYREEFEALMDPALRRDRVFFKGVVSDKELARYYAGCDIFVAPSRSESFGLITLEAMREGKPVIAGDVGGMREVVEHEGNGLLVPPGDAAALADALQRLIESPELREQFGRHSRELFLDRYTADRMAEGYERFCLELTGAQLL